MEAEFTKFNLKFNDRSSSAMFGFRIEVLSRIFELLSNKVQCNHLLITLMFLKLYPNTIAFEQLSGRSYKTLKLIIVETLSLIDNELPNVFFFNNIFKGLISTD
jgi:hypothetical protein